MTNKQRNIGKRRLFVVHWSVWIAVVLMPVLTALYKSLDSMDNNLLDFPTTRRATIDSVTDVFGAIMNNVQKNPRPMGDNAFICVTGVLSDLELANKMEYVVLPLQNAGYKVHLGFHLQNDKEDGTFLPHREPFAFGKPHVYIDGRYAALGSDQSRQMDPVIHRLYENPFDPSQTISVSESQYGRNLTQHRRREFSNRRSIETYLQSFNKTFHNDSSLVVDIFKPTTNLPMNVDLIQAMAMRGFGDIKFLRRDAFDRIVWLAVNQVRTLENMDRCWRNWLMKIGSSQSADNDLVVHAGEDTLLLQPIIVENVTNSLQHTAASSSQEMPMVVLPAKTKRGHNSDQLQIVLMPWARNYFTEPLKRFYKHGTFYSQNISSIPAYLEHLYSKLSNPHVHSRSSLPILFPMSADDVTKESNKTITNQTEQTLSEIKLNKTALVCITGQIQRLELENKLKNLIQPLENDEFHVDLAFVLTSGVARFQQRKDPTQNPKSNITNATTFAVFQEEKDLRDFIAMHNLSVISENLTFVPIPNLPINPQYALHLARNDGFKPHKPYASRSPSAIQEFLKQVFSNAKMVESYTRCWKDVMRSKNKPYDLYIRVRDDAGFKESIKPSLYEKMTPKTILTAHFRNNGGINDRLALVGRDAALCYFHLPFVSYYNGEYLKPGSVNPETYFKNVYIRQNLGCGLKGVVSKDLVPHKILFGRIVD